MSKLTLQFEGIVLREYIVGSSITIGRLPDNGVIIDNPAVSGHHARVVRDGDQLVLEDLRSTNGTFVNGRPVTRHVLRHGDEMLVGKHHLVFDQLAGESQPVPSPALQSLGDTVYLDTKQHRALRATLESARAEAATRVNARAEAAQPKAVAANPPVAKPAAGRQRRVGVLRVVAGSSDLPEYDLDAHTALIGRSDTALIRLRGWFKPSVAVAIARNGDTYMATPMSGKTMINDQRLTERRDLQDGDVLSVGGLTLEFRIKHAVLTESAA